MDDPDFKGPELIMSKFVSRNPASACEISGT